jgi:hypothetical protein
MNTTIDLPNEVYERLEKQAQARGKTIVETIEQVLAEAETNRRAAVIEQMRAEGKILPKHPLPPDYQRHYKRIEVQGKPVSECLIEERR